MENLSAESIISGSALIVSVISIVIALKAVNRSNYVNTVTTARIEYIQYLKDAFSSFCGISKWYVLGGYSSSLLEERVKEMDKLYYLIRLQLNTKHPFDKAVFSKMETILKNAKPGMITTDTIEQSLNELTLMVKSWIDFEWDCAKKEARWGKVKEKKRKEYEDKYLTPYSK